MKKNSRNKRISLSVIVPVYNEINLLRRSVHALNIFLNKYFSDYEILIVESGSTDGSKEMVDEIARELARVKTFHQKKRCGFGSALKVGYRKATKSHVWLVTVDFPFPLNSILKVPPLINKYDFILSFRVSDSRKWTRRLQSFVFNWLAKKVLGLPFKQVNSAFKIFKTSAIKKIHLYSDDWLIEAEILYQINKRRFSYIEVPIPLIDRKVGESKITFLTPLVMFKNLLLLKKRLVG